MIDRNMLDRDFFQICEENGEKYIHIFGYAYYVGDSVTDNPDEVYRVNDYTWFIVPLSEYLSEDFDYDAVQCGLTQYIGDYTEEALDEYLENNKATFVELTEPLTMETPCGYYY